MRKNWHIGYIGEGKYSTNNLKEYRLWFRIHQRCNSNDFHIKHPTYKDCKVCEEWHNFQNFAEWCQTQPNFRMDGFELDKDLKLFGNKIYGPEYCSFVPQEINCLLNDSKAMRGLCPQGVCYRKSRKKFRVRLSINNKSKELGSYNTPEEAFKVYKNEKETHIKFMANKHKNILDIEIYNNLINYKMEI